MPQRSRGHWQRRLRKHERQLQGLFASGAPGAPARRRLFGFEPLEDRRLMAVQPFPVPLTAVEPLGTLVYRGAATAAIDSAGETETFTITLDNPQQLTLVAEPGSTLAPTITVLDPAAAPIGSATAAAGGERAVLQSLAVTAPGTYTIHIDGASGTLGNFSLQLLLNSAVEADRVGGPANNLATTAQDLDPGFLAVGAGSAARSAVLGIGGGTGPTYSGSLTQNNNVFAGNVLPFDFTSAPPPVGDGILTLTAIADLDSASEFLTISAEGLFSQNAFVTGGLQQQLVTTILPLTQATLAQLAADGTISFTATPSGSVNNLGTNFLTMDLSYPTAGGPGELGGWFKFSLADGQSATLVAEAPGSPAPQLELYGPDGITLLAQATAQPDGSVAISDFTDTSFDLTTATYYVRVVSSAEYSLVVTRDASLENRGQSASSDGQFITKPGTVLGHLSGGSVGPNVSLALIQDRLAWGSSSNELIATELGYSVTVISSSNLSTADLTAFDVVLLSGDQFDSTYSNVVSNLPQIESYVNGGGVWLVNYAASSLDLPYFYDVLPGADGLNVTGFSGTNIDVLDPTSGLIQGPGGTIDNTNLDGGNSSIHGYTASTLPPGANAVLSNGNPSQVVAFDYSFGGGQVIVHTLPVEYYNGFTHGIGQIFHRNLFNFAASLGSDPGDTYAIAANIGNALSIVASVPGAGPGEFVNQLNVALELYDPLGNLVASDATGAINHVAAVDGNYLVRVFSEGDTRGEYVLEVNGQSGTLAPFSVTSSDPFDGAQLIVTPTEFVVDFSSPLLLSSVAAGDLTLDGQAATNVTVVDADTLRFTLPAVPDGTNSVSISAGAITNLQGQPLAAFASQFEVDGTAPHVIASSITEGTTAPGGSLVYTATFDDELAAANLDASDVVLVGLLSGFHAVSSFQFDEVTSTLTLGFNNLPEDEYTLTLLSGSGAFEDVYGRALDGERNPLSTVPSGDGAPGGNFEVHFATDFGVAPLPTPLNAVAPFGSLIYEQSISGVIGAGDTDSFTVDLDAGQTLSAVVASGSLKGNIQLFGHNGALLASVTAGAAGQDAVLQSPIVTVAGTYRIAVSGDSGTTGTYTLDLFLNAAIEREAHSGPANNSIATAQDLAGNFSLLGTGSAARTAVLGTADGAASDYYAFPLAANRSASVVLESLSPGNLTLELYDASGTLLARGAGASNVDQVIHNFRSATSNNFYVRVTGATAEYSLVVTSGADFDAEPNNSLGAQAQEISPSGAVLGAVTNGVSVPTGTGTPIFGPFDVNGSPLSLGFATDGSFVGSAIGARHNGIEYLLAGTPSATYAVAFDGAAYSNGAPSNATAFPVAMEDLSVGSQHLIRATGTVVPGVLFERTVSWKDGDDYALVFTRLTNNTGATLNNVGLLENHDPDPGGIFSTSNDVTSGGELVVAPNFSGAMALGSRDPRTVVSAEGFFIADPFEVIGSPIDPNGLSDDIAINLAFDLGNLAPGASETAAFVLAFGANQAAVEATFASVADLTIVGDNDSYAVQVQAGNQINVSVTIPGSGPREFVNHLDPAVELYDPLGVLVATSATGALSHKATLSGTYTVRVLAENDTRGEYVLRVFGHTGALPEFKVTSTNPADGAALVIAPTVLEVDLSDSILLSSVTAADLMIDGVSATGVTVVDQNTLRFDLPFLADGSHTLDISAGAISDLQGQLLSAFSMQLLIDSTGPRVIASSILEGEKVESGARTYTVQFDEKLDASTLDAGDIYLYGLLTGSHFPSDFSYDASTSILTVQYANLPEDDFTLVLLSNSNAFRDLAGNLLDGERNPTTTVPSGNGALGGDFELHFVVDTMVGAFPVPLVQLDPLGSLIYMTSATGRLSPGSDVDEYSVNLDAQQMMSLIVSAVFQAKVSVVDASGTVLASSTAGAIGQSVVLEFPADAAGRYTVLVESLGDTSGNYWIGARLNEMLEDEPYSGVPNNDPTTAEPLDTSFIPLGPGGGDRGAVLGLGGPNQGPTYSDSQTLFNNVYSPNILNFNFASTPAPVGDAILTISAIADLDATSEYLTISAEGLFSQDVFVFDGQQQFRVTTQIAIPLATLAQLAADGSINFTVRPSASVNNLGSNEVTLDLTYTTAGGSGDWYSFTLDDHESASVVMTAFTASDVLELYDATGAVRLATGISTTNGLSAIHNFVDQTSDGAPNTYMLRALVLSPEYRLVVTRDADFDTFGNDSASTAQDLSGIGQVLGHVGAGDEDWHKIAVNVGDNLQIRQYLPGSGAFEFVNPLAAGGTSQLQVELFDSAGNLVASGNGELLHTALLSGEYLLHVFSAGDSGEYVLSVDGATGANLPPSVVATTPLDGESVNVFPTTYTLTFSEALLEGTLEASDLLINGVPAATGVTQNGPYTYTFDLNPALNLGDGVYTVSLVANAVTDLQGNANAPLAATFVFDTIGPRITDVRFNGAPLPPGGEILSGALTVDVYFNESLREEFSAGQLGPEDVALINQLTNQAIAPSSVTYDAALNRATLVFAAVGEASYELTLFSGDGAFEDLAGNNLDGEAVGASPIGTPSGDGLAGGNYVIRFQVDSAGARSLKPFERLRPLGSFIASSTENLGIIGSPGDVDDFLVNFEAGQVISAVLTPSNPAATMFLTLVGIAGPVFAVAPGQPVVLPAKLIGGSGPLTLRVLGDATTTYTLDVYANAVHEQLVGDSADGYELALDATRLPLGGGRWGVIGEIAAVPSLSTIYTQDFNLGLGGFSFNNSAGSGNGLWHLSTGRQLDGKANHSPASSIYFGQGEGPFGGGNFNTGSATGGTATSQFIALPQTEVVQLHLNQLLATDGVFGRDLAKIEVSTGGEFVTLASTADGSLASNTLGEWRPVTVDLSQYAGLSVALRFSFDSFNAQGNDFEGWYIDDIQIKAANTFLADIDEYTVDLTPHLGAPVDFIVAAQSGGDLTGATIQLLGPDGTTVVATATTSPFGATAKNFDQAIFNYVPTQAGRYTLRIAADTPGEYGVVVTADLPFEAEPNDNVSGTPRNLNGVGTAVGFLGTGDQGGGGGAASRLFAIDANFRQIVEFDPETGAELNRIPVPGSVQLGGPDGLAYMGTSLFYATGAEFGGTTLYELDPDTGAILDADTMASLGISSALDGLGAYGGRIFTVDYVANSVYFFDPQTDTATGSWLSPVDTIGGGAGAGARGSIFVNNVNNAIYELDANTGQLLATLPAPAAGVYGLAFVDGSLYAGTNSGVVYELNPDTGAVLNLFQTAFSIYSLGGDDGSGSAPQTPLSGGSAASTSNGTPGAASSQYGTGSLTTLDIDLPGFDKNDPLAAAVGADLAYLALSSTGGGASLAAAGLTSSAYDLLQIVGDYVLVDAVADGNTEALWDDLLQLGLQQGSKFGRFVSGWLPVSAIVDMATLTSLRFAQPAYKPLTHVGVTTSQADPSMHSDLARTTFGVDGAGVTIGVLSDSYDTGPGSATNDMLTGDLPGPLNTLGHTTPINVLSDVISGTDEGRAMLQLVHDVAPGAALAFHTASNGQADFANGILELQSVAGADVIVDDVIYFAEPMFQDGIIAQAVDTVVANGATYFSSAGNNARSSWDGAYQASGVNLSGRQLHDFNPGVGVDAFQSINVPVGSSALFVFQWDSPFFSVSGGAGTRNDVDFFILDASGSSVLASGTTNNIGGDALEVVSFTNFSGSSTVNLAIGLSSGTAPGLMKWVAFGDPNVNEYASNSATAYGHANAAGAMAVGAADYRTTPAFGVNPPQIESFSSAGGIPILFTTTGTPTFDLRDKPEIVAPDGTNTTFFGSDTDFDGFPNFFGTSAAAPHAAAVAALMKQLAPTATPGEIYDALIGSTIDMDDPSTPGFDAGFDDGTGHGLINAVDALTLIAVDPLLLGPRVTQVDPVAGVTNDLSITEITLTFSEQLDAGTANDPAAYQLIQFGPNGVFDGGGGDDVVMPLSPLYDANQKVTLSIGDGATPLGFGKYRLVIAGDGTLRDLDGNPLNTTTGVGGGSDHVHDFEVVFEVPSGGDFYRIDLTFGQRLTLDTRTPWVDPLGALINDLDAQLIVYDGLGAPIAIDSNSADGRNALISFVALRDGPYFVQAIAESGSGEYLLDVEVEDVVLLGDFNRDGAVDAADYSKWRDSLGSTSLPFAAADGDGDGAVSQSDYNVWRSNFGATFATARDDQFVVVSGNGGGGALASTFAETPAFAEAQQTAADPVAAVLRSSPAERITLAAKSEAFESLDEAVVSFAGPLGDRNVSTSTPLGRRSGELLSRAASRGELLNLALDHELGRFAGGDRRFTALAEIDSDLCDDLAEASIAAADEYFSSLIGALASGRSLRLVH